MGAPPALSGDPPECGDATPRRQRPPVGVEPVEDADEQKDAPVLTLHAPLRAFCGLPVSWLACSAPGLMFRIKATLRKKSSGILSIGGL
mmetsp:Transcript_117864/g.328290  ORF Transcript_117864/g.328290 Transcript_117864/m.328290 type:complete len:89 (-) Transcript_117864:2565-2831(-)